jgi:hypothetical protein
MSVFIRLTVSTDNRLVIAGLLALAFTVTAFERAARLLESQP